MVDPALRNLRKNMTEAERRLWSRLRKEALGYEFRRQHRLGSWIVDFVCLERRLVVEVDGGQHNMSAGVARDTRRTEWLEADGFEVLRFWNNDVLAKTDKVVETIWHALRKPRPGLPPIRA
ncbi:endonuclease domain-containing protein [Parvibaculum sp.]|uniref:endonuclease domain-containing protein n=1 Tax=Parvibaculum sp. TaxID=2024848 RepID=UPI00272FCD48|nr:endonuclease domain-containing protein [Parvibaculum sp.]MDP1626485.1 endonuclease domain-containing protein [Parvibaculum sp.]MDP2150407.1 endonuclease domain-containing protein [Parvibaculum sp.]MDP3326859.1 endonuclease domain-containing protein [Parvibaculum sp.]